MGNTSITVINMLYRMIQHNQLMTDENKPNGKLCKLARPLDSTKEDVVINSLGNVKDDVSEGVLNVNIYVPNLKLPGNPEDKSQPDTARLLELSILANDAFEDGEEIWSNDGQWCFKLQQDNVFADTNNQHYLNLRIEFYSIN